MLFYTFTVWYIHIIGLYLLNGFVLYQRLADNPDYMLQLSKSNLSNAQQEISKIQARKRFKKGLYSQTIYIAICNIIYIQIL